MVDTVRFDPSNGQILVDDVVINVEVEQFAGKDEDVFVGEFDEDRPVEGVSQWYNEDIDSIIDFSYHYREE